MTDGRLRLRYPNNNNKQFRNRQCNRRHVMAYARAMVAASLQDKRYWLRGLQRLSVIVIIIISLIAATCSLTGSLNFGSLLQLKLMISIGKLYEQKKTKPRKEKQRRNILKGPFYTRLHDFNGSKQNAMLNADCACALSHAHLRLRRLFER